MKGFKALTMNHILNYFNHLVKKCPCKDASLCILRNKLFFLTKDAKETILHSDLAICDLNNTGHFCHLPELAFV